MVHGGVQVDYWDTDGQHIVSAQMRAGDCSITYAGGHSYHILSDDTRVYEVKSGPYAGSAAADKVYL